MQIRKVIRRIVAALGTAFFVVLYFNIENAATRIGLGDLLADAISPQSGKNILVDIVYHPITLLVSLFGLGAALGVWVDAIFLNPSLQQKRTKDELRQKAEKFGREVEIWTSKALSELKNKVNELPRLPEHEAREGVRFDRFHEIRDERRRRMTALYLDGYAAQVQTYFLQAEEFGINIVRNDYTWHISDNYQAQIVLLNIVGKLLSEGKIQEARSIDGNYVRNISTQIGNFI